MGNNISSARTAMVCSHVILIGTVLHTAYFTGMAVAGTGAFVTMSKGVVISSVFTEALIAALAVASIVIGVIIAVLICRFIIYKIVDGIIYLKQLADSWSQKVIDEHIEKAEEEAKKLRPDIFGAPTPVAAIGAFAATASIGHFLQQMIPQMLWDKMFRLLYAVVVELNLPDMALHILEIAKQKIPNVDATCNLSETTITILLNLKLKLKINEKDAEKKSDDLNICLWELFRTAFNALYKCIENQIIPAMPGTELSVVFFYIFAHVFKISAGLNHQTNVAEFKDLDEGRNCPTNPKPHTHKPISFPGNIYNILNVRLSALLESGYFYQKINEIELRLDTSGVVYLFKCKHCRLNYISEAATNNLPAFYVGITKNMLSQRFSGHKSSIRTKKDATVSNHIYSNIKGHGMINVADDPLFDNYQVNILLARPEAMNVDLRPHEVFYQWLIGAKIVMNKR